MKAEQAVSFPYPLASVWPVVAQVDVIARAFPGAELTGPAPDGGHRGTMTVRLGPTRVRWNGTARFTFHEEDGVIEIEARGADAKGRSRAQADAVVTLIDGPTGTTGTVSCTMHVEGPLASVASTAGVYVLEDLLGQLQENLSAEMAGATGPPGVASPSVPVSATAPPSANGPEEVAPSSPSDLDAADGSPAPTGDTPGPPRARARELSLTRLVGRVSRQRLAAMARWLRGRLALRKEQPR